MLLEGEAAEHRLTKTSHYLNTSTLKPEDVGRARGTWFAVFARLLLGGIVSGAIPCRACCIACSGTDGHGHAYGTTNKCIHHVGVPVSVLTALPAVKSRKRGPEG